MKKLTLSAILLNAFALIISIGVVVLYFLNKDELEIYNNLLGLIIVGGLSSVVSIIFLKLFNTKHSILLIIPALISYVIYLACFVALSTSENTNNVLGLLVIALYVIALVFALHKNAKWASVIVIVINGLLISTSLVLSAGYIIMNSASMCFIFLVGLFFVLVFASEAVYFVKNLVSNNTDVKEVNE